MIDVQFHTYTWDALASISALCGSSKCSCSSNIGLLDSVFRQIGGMVMRWPDNLTAGFGFHSKTARVLWFGFLTSICALTSFCVWDPLAWSTWVQGRTVVTWSICIFEGLDPRGGQCGSSQCWRRGSDTGRFVSPWDMGDLPLIWFLFHTGILALPWPSFCLTASVYRLQPFCTGSFRRHSKALDSLPVAPRCACSFRWSRNHNLAMPKTGRVLSDSGRVLKCDKVWWFGTFSMFPIYWEYSSQLTFIFFRGVAQPPTRLGVDCFYMFLSCCVS